MHRLSLLFLLLGCRQLRKSSTELSCEDAALAYNTCAEESPLLDSPVDYSSITASLACQSQPNCLGDYFSCVARSLQSSDCSTEEGTDAAMLLVSDCILPPHDPETCDIEQYLPNEDCGGAAPIIQEVVCSYPGMTYSPNDGEVLPLININVRVTDTDGDLTAYAMTLQVDSEIDGAVSTGARSYDLSGTTSDGICDTDESNIAIDFFLKGGFPYYSTTYELFFVVEDASGLSSPVYVQQCTMPDENGNPP
ncbi:MAG: hypothetical protein VX278_13125 [Myxococcota bacterium]|nr:hypothetical protein [Myxococcota bacterium]